MPPAPDPVNMVGHHASGYFGRHPAEMMDGFGRKVRLLTKRSHTGSRCPRHSGASAAAVNPWTWSVEMGYKQGEIVSGHTRTLYCSGQTAMSGDGTPQHAGDMASRLGATGEAPTTTMLGVTRLAIPTLMVELEGTAVA